MVRVRLKRIGTKGKACFRIVVMDQRSTRDGKAIEELGFFNPKSKEEKLDLERLAYWRGVGASITETVEAICKRLTDGIVLKDKVRVATPSMKAQAKAKAAAEAKAAEEAKKAEEAKAAAEAKAAEEAKKAKQSEAAAPAEEAKA